MKTNGVQQLSSTAFDRLAFRAIPKLVRIGAATVGLYCIPNLAGRTSDTAKTIPVSKWKAFTFLTVRIPNHSSLAVYFADSAVPNLVSFTHIASSFIGIGGVGTFL